MERGGRDGGEMERGGDGERGERWREGGEMERVANTNQDEGRLSQQITTYSS